MPSRSKKPDLIAPRFAKFKSAYLSIGVIGMMDKKLLCKIGHNFVIIMCLFFPSVVAAQGYQKEIDRIAEDVSEVVNKAGFKNVAVQDFTDLQGNVQELGRLMAEELTTSLVLKPRQFKTIDRGNLRSILNEAKLSMSGLMEPANTKKLKISGVDALIRGTLNPFEGGINLTVKVISAETAEIVGATRGVIPRTSATESLSAVLDTSLSSGDPLASSSAASSGTRFSFRDSYLRITLKSLRQDSESRIKAVFIIENTSKIDLFVRWQSPQLIDDLGEQWRMVEITGVSRYGGSDSTQLAPGAFVTALVVFKSDERQVRSTKKLSVVGLIDIYDGKRSRTFSPNIQDVPLGY